ncbi:MAG: hypothetical protein K1X74_07935 [Pirellulales bacterium]|nr:hypothetical protein [Pirellulales bacterium]
MTGFVLQPGCAVFSAGHTVLLAADWTDLIPVVVFILVGALSVMQKFFAAWREQARRQQQGPLPRADQARPVPRAGGVDPAREVEDFLRRVLQQGEPPKPPERPQPPKRPPPRVEVVETPRPPKVRRSAQSEPPARQKRSNKPETSKSGRGQLTERSLQSEVAARHVQSAVEQADERVEQQIHAHLDHRVSSIDDPLQTGTAAPTGAATDVAMQVQRTRTAARPGSRAAEIADLLQSGGARNAVVLAELLRRPEERWE